MFWNMKQFSGMEAAWQAVLEAQEILGSKGSSDELEILEEQIVQRLPLDPFVNETVGVFFCFFYSKWFLW